MRCFNQTLMIGRLTADPEQRVIPNGEKKVTSFSLAVQRDWYTQSDRKEIPTDFFRVSVWGKFGEFCFRVLKKGMTIFAVGHLLTHVYEGKNGKQTFTELTMNTVNILTWPKGTTLSPEAAQIMSLAEEVLNDDTMMTCNVVS